MKDLRSMSPRTVIDYFEKNWHPIRQQWVEGFKNSFSNFMTNTNNRLEAINQKLKAVICRYSAIPKFFADLMTCIKSSMLEREHRALNVTLKKSAVNFTDATLSKYAEVLTPFAFGHLKKQFDLIEKVKFSEHRHPENCNITAWRFSG
eukprot:m.257443 g.257443  ORF g.257443 m.257443 type:complete len:148 (+) comp40409_c0_seq24:702-1145(+)